jgi:predicted nuclease of predicted toxin-antitoxin system
MRFILDESAEFRLASYLTDQGHDVTTVARDYKQGLSDLSVLDIACSERRILLTNDSDFGELIFRESLPHAGVIYFRYEREPAIDLKIAQLERLLARGEAGLNGFLVISERGIRTR